MKTRAEIAWQARKILQETAERCPQYAPFLTRIAVEVSGRMTRCAGVAIPIDYLIKLSLPFYADDSNFESDLADTVKHEAAHIIAAHKALQAQRRIRPHGLEWRS